MLPLATASETMGFKAVVAMLEMGELASSRPVASGGEKRALLVVAVEVEKGKLVREVLLLGPKGGEDALSSS